MYTNNIIHYNIYIFHGIAYYLDSINIVRVMGILVEYYFTYKIHVKIYLYVYCTYK